MKKGDLVLHHIGIAIENIESGIEKLHELCSIDYQTPIIYDPNQRAHLCMLTTKDGVCIELVQGEIVKSYLKRNQKLYHMCYQTKDIEKTAERLVSDGAVQISEIQPAVLFEGRKVCFLMTEIGLIELPEGEL